MKKVSLILPLVVAFTLTGCGKSSAASSEGGNSSNPSKNEKVSFEFWHTLGQGIQDGLNDAIANFEEIIAKNEHVDVEVVATYQGAYNDIKTKIESGIAGNNIPSLAVAYPDHVASYLDYGPQSVANLDNYMDNDTYGFGTQRYLGDMTSATDSGKCDKEDIVPAFLREGQRYKYEGTYSLPWMKSSEVMFTNLNAVRRCFSKKLLGDDVFDSSVTTDADVHEFIETMTWDTLVELGKFAVAHKDKVLPEMVAPIMYDSDSNMFITKMYQNEIPFASIGENGGGVIDFESGENRTKAEAMAGEYVELVRDGVLTTKILQNGKYSSDFLANEKVIFAIGSSGGAGYNGPSGIDAFSVKTSKVPSSNNNSIYISQGPTLTLFNNANSKVTEYAWKFMKYITNMDVNQHLCVANSQGYIPIRSSCYESDYFADFLNSEENVYSDAAKVLLNDINGSYIESDTFKGSAALREQVGTIIATAYGKVKAGASVASAVTEVMNDSINEAKKKL